VTNSPGEHSQYLSAREHNPPRSCCSGCLQRAHSFVPDLLSDVPARSSRVRLDDFTYPFQPKAFYDPVTGDRLFSRACRNRTRGNGFKLKEGRFRLDIRKTFFRVKAVKHWHRLPGEAGGAPSLETFKAGLDGVLSSVMRLKMSLLVAGGFDQMALKGPFQPRPFCDCNWKFH